MVEETGSKKEIPRRGAESKNAYLDPEFLRKLERLKIAARRAFPGITRGERRSTRRGSSVEFADFRKYEVGDDFRHVDWNIYARLERLILKQFVEDEDVRIDILVDQSRSMHFGSPTSKFDCACRAAAALAFLGITSLDRVSISTFDSTLRTGMRAMRGHGQLLSLFRFLEELAEFNAESGKVISRRSNTAGQTASEESGTSGTRSTDAPTNLSAVLRAYQRYRSRAGVLFVISDFLDPKEFTKEMKLLARRGFDLNLIQVLATEEIDPDVGGDLLMVDSETGEAREVTASGRVVEAYRSMLNNFTSSLEGFCRSAGIGYTLITAATAFEDILLEKLIEGRMAE
jgi:uncharacterized protein (DUF58 family)